MRVELTISQPWLTAVIVLHDTWKPAHSPSMPESYADDCSRLKPLPSSPSLSVSLPSSHSSLQTERTMLDPEQKKNHRDNAAITASGPSPEQVLHNREGSAPNRLGHLSECMNFIVSQDNSPWLRAYTQCHLSGV